MRFSRLSLPEHKFKFLAFLALSNLAIILLIFIFFLPVFTNPLGLSVVLPRAITSEPLAAKDSIVLIREDDTFYWNNKKVSYDVLQRYADKKWTDTSQILIKADRRASVGALVKVWDLFRRAGIAKINIATNE